MRDFYAELPEFWEFTNLLREFVSTMARTEMAKLFRAGLEDPEEVTFIVSTSATPGLLGSDAHVWVAPFPDTPRFKLGYEARKPRPRYEWPNRDVSFATQCDDPIILRS
jgi:hypothetical protein